MEQNAVLGTLAKMREICAAACEPSVSKLAEDCKVIHKFVSEA